MDSKLGIAIALEGFAELALPENAKNAFHFMKAAEAIRNSIGAPLLPIDRPSYESSIATIREKLGETAFAEASARAQAEPWTAVVTELLTNPFE